MAGWLRGFGGGGFDVLEDVDFGNESAAVRFCLMESDVSELEGMGSVDLEAHPLAWSTLPCTFLESDVSCGSFCWDHFCGGFHVNGEKAIQVCL